MTEGQTWLTQESYDKLSAEKEALIANRPVIAAEINGGYHAAREQQGQEEARIRQLDELLSNATIGEAPTESGVAHVGSVVRVYFDGDEDDKETFLIATREEGSSKADLETFSPDSPIGQAVLGAKSGDTVEYPAPNGSMIKVTIVTAEPYKA